MPFTNSWLCIYAIAQIGKPYWFCTKGQISTEALYLNTVIPALDRNRYSHYDNYKNQYNVKVHDCSGLVLGALECDSVDGVPNGSGPIAHYTTSQFYNDSNVRSSSMNTFPKIPGTLVFISDSSGGKSHVGIYVGKYIDLNGVTHENMVVEAASHRLGVISSPLSSGRWDSWSQLTKCEIDTTVETVFDARTFTVTNTATPAAANTTLSTATVEIHTEAMTPFIATVLNEHNPTLNYTRIKDARISGMMFFGGQLYDGSRVKRTYMNPSLPNQIKQCNNAGMPYALYVNVRSKSRIEADEECRALYYVVSRFPPKLGIWLSLQTNNSIINNDNILEVYYNYFEKWGLNARCGLYLKKPQLSKITWDSFKDRFYLWLIDPMNVDEVDDELLQPEMFEVPD